MKLWGKSNKNLSILGLNSWNCLRRLWTCFTWWRVCGTQAPTGAIETSWCLPLAMQRGCFVCCFVQAAWELREKRAFHRKVPLLVMHEDQFGGRRKIRGAHKANVNNWVKRTCPRMNQFYGKRWKVAPTGLGRLAVFFSSLPRALPLNMYTRYPYRGGLWTRRLLFKVCFSLISIQSVAASFMFPYTVWKAYYIMNTYILSMN
jgi:hypothetical protein